MGISHSDYFPGGDLYWKVNNKPSGFYPHILRAMFDQVFAFLCYHSRLFAVRYDLHQPSFTADNQRMTTFIRRLSKQLNTRYGFKYIGYVWVREQVTGQGQHYHLLLLLDGKLVQHPQRITEICRQIWQDMSGTLYVPDSPYYNIKRSDQHTLAKLLFRLSYFAKAKDKDRNPTYTNNYGRSRIKPKLGWQYAPSSPALFS
ncbi:YagK/YfjJ domain-containing protein [Shewanella cyperi]|uniref:YagK/YfjJ domain-containing protein n=1 Tax=Shewanella cyperi TaxID=2814292 RepID=UPI001A93E283|nr:inovirus-type Gp2 protein [Shewanella cyperi]QSX39775.1 inovirus-type Gp2 protein [Shewanella cyperi]